MTRFGFAFAGAAALTLGACSGSNQDSVANADINQPAAEDLNGLSSDAANDAAMQSESEALSAQAKELNQAAADNNAINAEAANAVTANSDEQNVSGM